MSDDIERKCPDCDVTLQEIKLIDKGHMNQQLGAEYTSAEARKG